MSWDRNNLATHAPPSILRDSLSSSSAGLNLVRHLGRFGNVPRGRRQRAKYITSQREHSKLFKTKTTFKSSFSQFVFIFKT